MSGGSMDYLYLKVDRATFSTHTPERRAFRRYLDDVLVPLLRAIEWNDSCDGDDRESELMQQCLGSARIAANALTEAKDAYAALGRAIRTCDPTWRKEVE